MIAHQKHFFAFILLSLNVGINSFSTPTRVHQLVSPSSSTIYKTRFLTSIHATEESNEGEAEQPSEEPSTPTDGAKASSIGDDILNSPAFLKRKVEVLKSDIEKVNEKISEANKVYEANKAEWGPQLDDLRKEVSL